MTKNLRNLTVVASCVLALFIWGALSPVVSRGDITVQGSVGPRLGLFGGAAGSSTITAPAGITDENVVAPTDNPAQPAGNFTGTFFYGDLEDGDGTNATARCALRVRGNVPCHVSCSVASSTTSGNLRYSGVNQTGALVRQQVTLGTGGGAVAGGQGSTAGHSYGARFTSGTDTLATLNGGATGGVVTGSDKVSSFTSSPSLSGNLSSANNYVEIYPTFAVPTGLAWSATAGGGAWFTIVLEFEVFSGS